jgi:hypothetical protein
MYIKDYERLARSMNNQKLDPEYIRYYLIETYQVTNQIVDDIFTTVGVGAKASSKIPSEKTANAKAPEKKDPKAKAPGAKPGEPVKRKPFV